MTPETYVQAIRAAGIVECTAPRGRLQVPIQELAECTRRRLVAHADRRAKHSAVACLMLSESAQILEGDAWATARQASLDLVRAVTL